jgi:hypothetical protein
MKFLPVSRRYTGKIYGSINELNRMDTSGSGTRRGYIQIYSTYGKGKTTVA